jgi:hypothetical protein
MLLSWVISCLHVLLWVLQFSLRGKKMVVCDQSWITITQMRLQSRTTTLFLFNDSLLDWLSGAKFFTKIDLHSANNLVRVFSRLQYLTAFCTRFRHFEHRVILFDLLNAPAVSSLFLE